jgi:hypothetical protein
MNRRRRKTMDSPNKYKIGEIAIDTDGTFWIACMKDIAEQGGIRFGWGSVGTTNLGDALALLEQFITKHKDQLDTKITKFEEEKDNG